MLAGDTTGTSADNSGVQRFAALQLLSNGGGDPSFGTAGLAAVAYPVGTLNQAQASAEAIQPDGKLVLAGSVVTRGYSDFVGGSHSVGYTDTEFAISH